MPSSSARCAQLPRAVDKVPYYLGLKKIRDHLKGDLPVLDESEVIFPGLEPKFKSEAKDDASDEDEDSRLSCGDSSAKEMTLEQIQNQAEYLEALIASAEGKDVSLEGCRGKKLRFLTVNRGDYSIDTETSGSGDEMSQLNTRKLHQLKPRQSHTTSMPQPGSRSSRLAPGLEIKQEASYDESEYGSLAVNGPAAQKVSLDDVTDPYHDHLSGKPQYMNLGDLPRKKGSTDRRQYTSIRSSILSQLSQHPAQRSSTSHEQTSITHSRIPIISESTKALAENTSSLPQRGSHRSVCSSEDTKSPTFCNI